MTKSITKKAVSDTVKITKKGATVQSDRVAKVFDKAHKHLLSQIDKEISFLTAENLAVKSYFIEDDYINSRGKLYKRYQLTRKGFDYIVLGWTGKKAKLYKLWFIDEFHRKSDVIQKNKQIAYENNENPVWLEFREISKETRTELTDSIQKYLLPQREEENKETSQFVARYITSYTNLIYRKLGIEIPKGITANRDTFSVKEISDVRMWEGIFSEKIKTLATQGIHYKEVYKQIKEELK